MPSFRLLRPKDGAYPALSHGDALASGGGAGWDSPRDQQRPSERDCIASCVGLSWTTTGRRDTCSGARGPSGRGSCWHPIRVCEDPLRVYDSLAGDIASAGRHECALRLKSPSAVRGSFNRSGASSRGLSVEPGTIAHRIDPGNNPDNSGSPDSSFGRPGNFDRCQSRSRNAIEGSRAHHSGGKRGSRGKCRAGGGHSFRGSEARSSGTICGTEIFGGRDSDTFGPS